MCEGTKCKIYWHTFSQLIKHRMSKKVIPHRFFYRAINLLYHVIWTSLILCTNLHRFLTYDTYIAAFDIGVYQWWSLRSKCCDKVFLASVKEMAGNIHKRLSDVYGNAAVDMSSVGCRAKREGDGGSRNSASRWRSSSSVKEVTIAVYWDCEGVSLLVVTQRETIIKSDPCISTLEKEKKSFQRVRPDRNLLERDKATAYAYFKTRGVVTQLGWTVLLHPPYSAGLVPSFFFTFSYLWKMSGEGGCKSDDVVSAVRTWLHEQDKELYRWHMPGRGADPF